MIGARGLAALLAFALAACGSNAQPLPPDAGEEDQGVSPDGQCALSLAAVSPASQNVTVGGTAELVVRVSSCRGDTVEGAAVSFVIKGNAPGSSLSGASAQSDANGIAQVTLTAGQQAAAFQVEASIPDAATVTFQVSVNALPLGTIEVQMTYSGTKTFGELVAYAYPNQPCGGLDPFSLPSSALQVATPVSSLADRPKLANLAAASYTVVVTAKSGTELTGWGCTAAVNVTAGATTTAPLTIVDLPIVYSGIYLLDSQLDLTGALPPSVATTVKLLDEATDDHELQNESNVKGNNQYGLDPAAFLLDFIFREICRWECGSGQSFDTCSQTNHPKGDLRALYWHPFMSWSAAQPYFWGLCSAIDFPLPSGGYVHTYLQSQLQAMILAKVPGVVVNLTQIFGDIAAAFTKLHLRSKLTLTDVGLHRIPGGYTHVLETMELSVHDLAGNLLQKSVKLADAGLTNLSYTGNATTKDDKLQIPKHAFQLAFGKLVQYLYLNVALPALGYTSTAHMFQSWVDCTQVGNWLYQQVSAALGMSPLSAATYKGFCDLGLQAAGKWVEDEIAKSVGTLAKLEMSGTCSAGLPLGPKRLALKLVNGVWTGTMSEGTWSAPFTGTFTGQRQ